MTSFLSKDGQHLSRAVPEDVVLRSLRDLLKLAPMLPFSMLGTPFLHSLRSRKFTESRPSTTS